MVNLFNENQGIIGITGVIVTTVGLVLAYLQYKKHNSVNLESKLTINHDSPYIKAGGNISAGRDIIINNKATEKKNEKKYISMEDWSSEMGDIYKEALKEDRIYLFKVDQLPDGFIRIGRHNFHKENDNSYATRYVDALHELVELGFIKHVSGSLYRLKNN